MSAVKITEGIYSVGIMNPNMRVFDIVMKTDSGTSYNSYLVRGSEKPALIEPCHESFFEEYLENIKEVCKFEEIDYIVMNHNEPDHSGSLAKLLELIQEGCKKFALCHLSQENNTPALALQTMFNTLGAAGVVPEKDCIVQAQRRNEISPTLTF